MSSAQRWMTRTSPTWPSSPAAHRRMASETASSTGSAAWASRDLPGEAAAGTGAGYCSRPPATASIGTLRRMPRQIVAPRGTHDLLPEDGPAWERLEAVARDLANRYAFDRMETPLFERVELFARGLGESSDAVAK